MYWGCVDSVYNSWYIRNRILLHCPENVLSLSDSSLQILFQEPSSLNLCVTVRIILFLSLRRRISHIQAFYSSSQCDHLRGKLVTQARPISWNCYCAKLKEDFFILAEFLVCSESVSCSITSDLLRPCGM